jgi:hypothetical protein
MDIDKNSHGCFYRSLLADRNRSLCHGALSSSSELWTKLTLCQIQPWTRADNPAGKIPLPRLTGLEGEIMTSIANLSNHVLAAPAMNNLKRWVQTFSVEV